MRMPSISGLARVGAGLIAFVLVLAGCGQESTPTLEVWTQEWERTRTLLPPRAELDGSDAATICETALNELRDAGDELTPAPDEVLGDAVDAWLDDAREAMFECGPSAELDQLYESLARAEQEIEGFLGRG